MGDVEWEFLKDQRNERNAYFDSFTERKWRKTMKRRAEGLFRIEKMREANERERIHSTCN